MTTTSDAVQRRAVTPQPISKVLGSLSDGTEGAVTVGMFLATARSGVHGVAILLLVLPEVLPLPLPSAAAILGIPLMLVAGHLALFGESGRLPSTVLSLTIPHQVLATIARYVSPVLSRVEMISRPRWDFLVHDERLIGLVCLCLSVILFLPIPFVNSPPAICLALIALGMIQHDGLMIAVGMGGGALLLAALGVGVYWAGSLV